jgi:hypothetical protein
MGINVYVHLISAASIVKSIIVFVIQIYVGMMVRIHIQFYYRIIHILILFLLGNCSVFNTTFNCTCVAGWEGGRCQTQINDCGNVTCMNYGVCRPLFRDYKCECLNGSFYGVYCEITTTKIIILRIVSKSFAFIAIIAMVSVVTFIIVMDVLKYFFGIDPTRKRRMQIRQIQQEKQNESDDIGPSINVIPPSPIQNHLSR